MITKCHSKGSNDQLAGWFLPCPPRLCERLGWSELRPSSEKIIETPAQAPLGYPQTCRATDKKKTKNKKHMFKPLDKHPGFSLAIISWGSKFCWGSLKSRPQCLSSSQLLQPTRGIATPCRGGAALYLRKSSQNVSRLSGWAKQLVSPICLHQNTGTLKMVVPFVPLQNHHKKGTNFKNDTPVQI